MSMIEKWKMSLEKGKILLNEFSFLAARLIQTYLSNRKQRTKINKRVQFIGGNHFRFSAWFYLGAIVI